MTFRSPREWTRYFRRAKISSGAPKNKNFHSICLCFRRFARATVPGSIFGRKINEKSIKFENRFFNFLGSHHLFLRTRRHSRNIIIYDTLSTFRFLRFCVVFEKMSPKSDRNRCLSATRFFVPKTAISEPKMIPKRRPRASQNGSGDRTLSKNNRSQKLYSYSVFTLPKKCKNQKKTSILGYPFFVRFATLFALFSHLSRNRMPLGPWEAPGAPREAPRTAPGPLRDRFFDEFG